MSKRVESSRTADDDLMTFAFCIYHSKCWSSRRLCEGRSRRTVVVRVVVGTIRVRVVVGVAGVGVCAAGGAVVVSLHGET